MTDRPRRGEQREARTLWIPAERLDDDHPLAGGVPVRRGARKRAGRLRITTGECDDAHVSARQLHEDDGAVAAGGFDQGQGGLASEQIREGGRIDNPADDRIIGVGGRDDVLAGSDLGQQLARRHGVGEVALGAELLKDGEGLVEIAFGDGARARFGDQASECQMAERGLVALAQQIEEGRALREIVIRVGRRRVLCVQRPAQPQVLAPGRRRDAWIECVGGGRQPLLGVR